MSGLVQLGGILGLMMALLLAARVQTLCREQNGLQQLSGISPLVQVPPRHLDGTVSLDNNRLTSQGRGILETSRTPFARESQNDKRPIPFSRPTSHCDPAHWIAHDSHRRIS